MRKANTFFPKVGRVYFFFCCNIWWHTTPKYRCLLAKKGVDLKMFYDLKIMILKDLLTKSFRYSCKIKSPVRYYFSDHRCPHKLAVRGTKHTSLIGSTEIQNRIYTGTFAKSEIGTIIRDGV